MTKTETPGPFAETIDFFYTMKLMICMQWDALYGLQPTDHASAVGALNLCYAVRRPGFEFLDQILGLRS